MQFSSDPLLLNFGVSFEDLYDRPGLVRLDDTFVNHLRAVDASLCERLLIARANPSALDRKQSSDLIIDLAPHLENFIGELFHIPDAIEALRDQHEELAPLYAVK